MIGIIKFILIILVIEGVVLNFYRIIRRYVTYKKALAYSKKINKPLLVVGDPDAGFFNRTFTRVYGCGDLCTDLDGCNNCENSEKGDILDVLKNKSDKSFVIFESCVLECINDKNKIQEISNEMNRVGIKLFQVRIKPTLIINNNLIIDMVEK